MTRTAATVARAYERLHGSRALVLLDQAARIYPADLYGEAAEQLAKQLSAGVTVPAGSEDLQAVVGQARVDGLRQQHRLRIPRVA